MRKHFHVDDNHLIKVYRCGFHEGTHIAFELAKFFRTTCGIHFQKLLTLCR